MAIACALTIGNFDGVHRGHQATLALLKAKRATAACLSCVMTFEPHPRDYFAAVHTKPELAPSAHRHLRDKLTELAHAASTSVVLPFTAVAAPPEGFIDDVLVQAWA